MSTQQADKIDECRICGRLYFEESLSLVEFMGHAAPVCPSCKAMHVLTPDLDDPEFWENRGDK